MKKFLVLALVCMFTINLVAFEAVGKSRSIKRSFSKPAQQSTVKPAPTQQTNQTKTVKKQPTTQQTPANTQPKSNFLRNAGMLAGGMLLGGMLASLFGGSEMLANLFGMIFNLVFLALVLGALFVIARFLWRKITDNNPPSR